LKDRTPVSQIEFRKLKGKPTMVENTTKKSRGGRPAQYTLEQIHTILVALLADGLMPEEIDAKLVKSKLCSYFDVSPGINEQSLLAHVLQVLADISGEQERSILAALPKSVDPAVDEMLAELKRHLLLLVGQENAVCQQEATREVEVLRLDKRNANWRISELETKVSDLVESNSELQAKCKALQADLEKAAATRAKLETELNQKTQSVTMIDQFLNELREPVFRDAILKTMREITSAPDAEVS
jgi:hypothetical protein